MFSPLGLENRDASAGMFHLNILAKNFGSALELFDHAALLETRSFRYSPWKFIAARDAAITVCEFKRTLDLTKDAARKDPETRQYADEELLRFSHRLFAGQFKDWDALRDAAVHTYKTVITQDQIAEHGSGAAHFTIMGRTYSVAGFNGAVPSMEISQESSDCLWQIVGAVYEGLSRCPSDPFTRYVINDPSLLTLEVRSRRRGQYLKDPFAHLR